MDKMTERIMCEIDFVFIGVRNESPIRTGNLRHNAIREQTKPMTERGSFERTLFVDEKIAPYMKFTNERWNSEKHYGHSNPNQGWWENACERAIQRLATALGGTLEEV